MAEVYNVSSVSNGVHLAFSSFMIWAAFEQDQLGSALPGAEISPEIEARTTRWETLLPVVASMGVLLAALTFRDRMSEDLIPVVIGASILFITSIGVRNWWGHQLETSLRNKALVNEAGLKSANRELREEMVARSRAQEELRQSQKMDALGQLTGGVAHDFNNLLTVVLGNLELLEGNVALDAHDLELLCDATKAAQRGAELTQRLLALSRKQDLKAEPIEVGALLDSIESLLSRTLGEKIQVTTQGQENAWLCMADRAQLENALLNLSINARDAMPEGGKIAITATDIFLDEKYVAAHPDAQTGNYVAFSVQDTGKGISQEDLPHVFEPFFTTKEAGSGTGLGLSTVYGFAKQSGGHVTIESGVGRGTRIVVFIPRCEKEEQNATAENHESIPRGRGEMVLLVEDEPAVRALVRNLLEDLGYAVTAAQDGDNALELLEGMESVDLLLSDVVLPGSFSGRELANAIQQLRPHTQILLMSGYAPDALSNSAVSGSTYELLHKPFRKAEIARRARASLDSRNP
jgi:signal transduction histidine kinase/CheY-like chemotaxis protein